ncbi:DUF3644 domain-containing protein [Oleispirillum naphthae]|uniref:DUF3644 domain-containing protein n=1 Tax=Oleispirillum naphthae TaxID=2838853 RepID=UPI003B67712F
MRDEATILIVGLFQACCMNFDKRICNLFGNKLTLSHDLSFPIQFTKPNAAHHDYTFPDQWVQRLEAEANDAQKFAGLKFVRL